MRIVVFGSTGRVGSSIVEQALSSGHDVVAYARSASLARLPPGVEVHEGQLDDAEAIANCVAGADVVLSALGLRKNSPDQAAILVSAYDRICAAMTHARVGRLVAISGSGTRLPDEQVTFGRRVLRVLMKLLDRHVLEANEEVAKLIMETQLEWVLVRPPRIKDGEATGARATSLTTTKTMQITVGDVAAFMLESAISDEWVCKAPFISAP